jgi:hypothetical protein
MTPLLIPLATAGLALGLLLGLQQIGTLVGRLLPVHRQGFY